MIVRGKVVVVVSPLMGIVRVVTERDLSRVAASLSEFHRGWSDVDKISLKAKLTNPGPYWNAGILRLTRREYRALQTEGYSAPLLVWCDDYGLFPGPLQRNQN
jgi:hypothetical protein